MKLRLFTILIITSLYFGNKAVAQEKASDIMNIAFTKAKKENKNVFLIFHASWCGWCKKMDKQILDDCCKKLFTDNYIITHLVVLESDNNKHLENPGAAEILKKYKGDKSGIPFWLIFDKNGKLLEDSFDSSGQNLGCPASKGEVPEFINKLKSTSKLTNEELKIIENKFVNKS